MTPIPAEIRRAAFAHSAGTLLVTDIAIVGGGASGTILAAQILARGPEAPHVTILDPGPRPGCGLAYSTQRPEHLLNTRSAQMSAVPGDPDHFCRWLAAHDPGLAVDPAGFAGRSVYGTYLEDLLAPWRDRPEQLALLAEEAVGAVAGPDGVVLRLASGRVLRAGQVVLATGHARASLDPTLSDPWGGAAAPAPEADIVILGTGLTMVDQVLTLLALGHRGRITAVSRRGLLPRAHASGRPVQLPPLPTGLGIAGLLRQLRRMTVLAEAQGGSWRDVVDMVRPQVQTIWQGLAAPERARFLRHAATWWEVHRHRMPESSAKDLAAAQASGQLAILRAGFLGADLRDDGRLAVTLKPRQRDVPTVLACDHIIDCRGIRRDPEACASALMADLLLQGLARIDRLRIGPEVDGDCRLVGREGPVHPRISGLGPVTRARFWEITAIPDIREQAARLAARLCDDPRSPSYPAA